MPLTSLHPLPRRAIEPAPCSRSSAARSLLSSPLLLIAAAAVSFWASDYKTDGDGFHTTATHTYSTPTRALTTENIDVGTDVPGWLESHLGTIRIDPQGDRRVRRRRPHA